MGLFISISLKYLNIILFICSELNFKSILLKSLFLFFNISSVSYMFNILATLSNSGDELIADILSMFSVFNLDNISISLI